MVPIFDKFANCIDNRRFIDVFAIA